MISKIDVPKRNLLDFDKRNVVSTIYIGKIEGLTNSGNIFLYNHKLGRNVVLTGSQNKSFNSNVKEFRYVLTGFDQRTFLSKHYHPVTHNIPVDLNESTFDNYTKVDLNNENQEKLSDNVLDNVYFGKVVGKTESGNLYVYNDDLQNKVVLINSSENFLNSKVKNFYYTINDINDNSGVSEMYSPTGEDVSIFVMNHQTNIGIIVGNFSDVPFSESDYKLGKSFRLKDINGMQAMFVSSPNLMKISDEIGMDHGKIIHDANFNYDALTLISNRDKLVDIVKSYQK